MNKQVTDLVSKHLRQQWKDEGLYPNRTVFEEFVDKCKLHPDKVAFIDAAQTLTYKELLSEVLKLAQAFKSLGLTQGDVLSYQLKNSGQCAAIDLAVASLGGIVSPFPPGKGKLDIESLLKRADSKFVIVEHDYAGINFCDVVDSIKDNLNLEVLICDSAEPPKGWKSLEDLFSYPELSIDALPTVDPDSLVRYLVSSGTESEPKLVAYTHNALLGGRGGFLKELNQDFEDFRGFYLVPLGSSFGSTAVFGVIAYLGGTVIVVAKFDANSVVDFIAKHQPDYLLGVPTMLQRLIKVIIERDITITGLKAVISGGALIDETTINRCCKYFNCSFVSLYGSADGVNCYTTINESTDKIIETVGKPNPKICTINIIDDKGTRLPDTQVGEVIARGPITPNFYVGSDKLNNTYRDKDGWVYTGDLGYIDKDGYLSLAGRKKDIIIRGGVNISPAQIEKEVTKNEKVLSVAAIPVKDLELGARICLFVTLKDKSVKLTLNQVREFLTERGLEFTKLPEYLVYIKDMPINSSGKLDRKKLEKSLNWLSAS